MDDSGRNPSPSSMSNIRSWTEVLALKDGLFDDGILSLEGLCLDFSVEGDEV